MRLETDRLIIRPVCKETDTEQLFRFHKKPEVSKYISLEPNNIEDMLKFIDKSSREINVPGTWFHLVVIEQESNIIIGDMGIHFLDNQTENKQVELGISFDSEFGGMGYANETTSAVIDFLFNTLEKHRIIAAIDPTNMKSINMVQRLGFRKEAHFIKGDYFKGEWVDELIYAILKEEWNSKKTKM